MLPIFIYIFLHTSYNLLRHRIHLCNKSHAHVSELFALFDIRPTEHAVFRVPVNGVARGTFHNTTTKFVPPPPPAYQTYGTESHISNQYGHLYGIFVHPSACGLRRKLSGFQKIAVRGPIIIWLGANAIKIWSVLIPRTNQNRSPNNEYIGNEM